MKTRREFIQGAAAGAVVLGSAERLAMAAAFGEATGAKSRVVVARDAQLHSSDGVLDEKRVNALLDRAIAQYTGHDKPVAAWKQIVGSAKTVGLKVNGLGGKGISTHAVLIHAVAARLQAAGIEPGNIVVWDRTARDLEACGMTVATDPKALRCYGNDVAGYEEQSSSFGSASQRISKILTRDCEMTINMPILKDHQIAGVTFAMKNMYGVINSPFMLHKGSCNPGVADLNAIPAIRDKVRFTIGDAMSSVYDGGPGFKPERLWQPNALIVGEDRVAIDHVAWQMLEKKRAEVGMPSFEAAGRKPTYIATAADATHKLGTDDPAHMHVMEV
jgi:uncharacterized protein (DUF362 family)